MGVLVVRIMEDPAPVAQEAFGKASVRIAPGCMDFAYAQRRDPDGGKKQQPFISGCYAPRLIDFILYTLLQFFGRMRGEQHAQNPADLLVGSDPFLLLRQVHNRSRRGGRILLRVLLFFFGRQLDQHNRVSLPVKPYARDLTRFKGFRHRKPAADEFPEKFLFFQAQPFLMFRLIDFLVALLLSLRLYAVGDIPQCFEQLRTRNGLQQVLRDTDADGLTGITEIIVAAQNNDFGGGKLLPHEARQFKTVHKRHPDIRNEDIRMCAKYHLISPLAVSCFPDQLKPCGIPVHGGFDRLPDHILVFY